MGLQSFAAKNGKSKELFNQRNRSFLSMAEAKKRSVKEYALSGGERAFLLPEEKHGKYSVHYFHEHSITFNLFSTNIGYVNKIPKVQDIEKKLAGLYAKAEEERKKFL